MAALQGDIDRVRDGGVESLRVIAVCLIHPALEENYEHKTLLRQMKFTVRDNIAQQEGKHETWQNASVSFNNVDKSLK